MIQSIIKKNEEICFMANLPRLGHDKFPLEWLDLKVLDNSRHPKYELETIHKEDWSQIPSGICLNLVNNYNKRLADVIKHKRYKFIIRVLRIYLVRIFFYSLFFCKLFIALS